MRWSLGFCLLLALGCDKKAPETEPSTPRELSVFAAASLREAFTTLAKDFEKSKPGTHVVLNFAGSQALRTQIENGAPADVFASADQKQMSLLVKAGRAEEPLVFALNEPVVVVSTENADKIHSLADLPSAARVVFGADDVPIGRYTQEILKKAAAKLGADFPARVRDKVVSHEPDVKQVLAKVSLGEADAGIVYRTDALGAGIKVAVVTIPPEWNVTAEYPLALVKGSSKTELAREWVTLVISTEGQAALRTYGFLPAPGAAQSNRL